MLQLKPHQIEGARALASGLILLADEPRVGKTGAMVVAADLCLERKLLVVTTATNRAGMKRDIEQWQMLPRKVQVLHKAGQRIADDTDAVVVAWSTLSGQADMLMRWRPDRVVLDESHYAKSYEAKRTMAAMSIAARFPTWCLSGTPMPNSPLDLWPMLLTLAPSTVKGMTQDSFMERYCVVRRKWLAGEMKPIVMGGKNEEELRERIKGLWLRRTQADVGITQPIYSTLLVEPTATTRRQILAAAKDLNLEAILDAAETGETGSLDMHLGALRRMTGTAKAHLVADVVKEEFADGRMSRVVLMCWHTETIDTLAQLLSAHDPVVLDGRTPPAKRLPVVEAFQNNRAKVFIGQILAAGEAIDLSISRDLIFVEASFTPKDMKQAALRVTNLQRQRSCFVRIAAFAGSIDEALTAVLTRKVASIRKVEQ
jgi:SNF2 family DNA or RNA helicase